MADKLRKILPVAALGASIFASTAALASEGISCDDLSPDLRELSPIDCPLSDEKLKGQRAPTQLVPQTQVAPVEPKAASKPAETAPLVKGGTVTPVAKTQAAPKREIANDVFSVMGTNQSFVLPEIAYGVKGDMFDRFGNKLTGIVEKMPKDPSKIGYEVSVLERSPTGKGLRIVDGLSIPFAYNGASVELSADKREDFLKYIRDGKTGEYVLQISQPLPTTEVASRPMPKGVTTTPLEGDYVAVMYGGNGLPTIIKANNEGGLVSTIQRVTKNGEYVLEESFQLSSRDIAYSVLKDALKGSIEGETFSANAIAYGIRSRNGNQKSGGDYIRSVDLNQLVAEENCMTEEKLASCNTFTLDQLVNAAGNLAVQEASSQIVAPTYGVQNTLKDYAEEDGLARFSKSDAGWVAPVNNFIGNRSDWTGYIESESFRSTYNSVRVSCGLPEQNASSFFGSLNGLLSGLDKSSPEYAPNTNPQAAAICLYDGLKSAMLNGGKQ